MNDEKDPLLLDHEADGIRELDNLLPRWWVWLFYLTTIFAILYFGYYHVADLDRDRAVEVGDMVQDEPCRPGGDRRRLDQLHEAGVARQRPGRADPVAHRGDGRAQGVGQLLAGRVVDPLAALADVELDRLGPGGRNEGSG